MYIYSDTFVCVAKMFIGFLFASKHIYSYKCSDKLVFYTTDVYKNIARLNVNCMGIHICLTRSLKNPYQEFINIASYQCVINLHVFSYVCLRY